MNKELAQQIVENPKFGVSVIAGSASASTINWLELLPPILSIVISVLTIIVTVVTIILYGVRLLKEYRELKALKELDSK